MVYLDTGWQAVAFGEMDDASGQSGYAWEVGFRAY